MGEKMLSQEQGKLQTECCAYQAEVAAAEHAKVQTDADIAGNCNKYKDALVNSKNGNAGKCTDSQKHREAICKIEGSLCTIHNNRPDLCAQSDGARSYECPAHSPCASLLEV